MAYFGCACGKLRCFQRRILSIFLHNYKVVAYEGQCNNYCSWKNVVSGDAEICLSRDSLKLSCGKLARFTDGSCTAQHGDTSVMVTAISKTKASTNSSFLPLLVDYRQKTAAAGFIPTNYIRREMGPTEKETLTSRLIDRSIRPLFPQNYFYETQLLCSVRAVDRVHDPDVVGINAASAALAVSDIPWNGPVGAVRVGMLDGQVLLNPTHKELEQSQLNLVIAAAEHSLVVMLEASADDVVQQDFMKALKAGVKETQLIVKGINELQKRIGKPKRVIDDLPSPSSDVMESAVLLCEAKVKEIFTDYSHHKLSRDQAVEELKKDVLEKLKEHFTETDTSLLVDAINRIVKSTFRNLIMETSVRCDGRDLTDVRDISCSVDVYKPLHGSALFQRGQTQVLCTVTLDSLDAALHNDPMSVITSGIKEKNFILHYEFPPYSTYEIGRFGFFGRRELGHGALAEKSLRPALPTDYPFTIRLNSEVLESNGSSSMATVCGGSLALMDAGVPMSAPIAGIAIGLISSPDPQKSHELLDYKLLTDILGIEDYLGDMDFKLAGSKKGITGLQLDVKIPGLPLRVVMEALKQGFDGKTKILAIMRQTISKSREEKKENWPVCGELEVPVHKRSHFFGSGGYNVKKLTSQTGVHLIPTSENNFSVFAPNQAAMDEAKEVIDKLLHEEKEPELQFGAIYTATIVELRDAGAMVTLYPNMKPALLPNSQLDQRKVFHPSALGLEVGQKLTIKYFGRDPANGSMRMSRKVLQSLPNFSVRNLEDKNRTSSQNDSLQQ